MYNNFLEENRQVTFDWHIYQVKKWLAYDNGRKLDNTLVYASLELRCAIERYIFELLVILRKGQLNPKEERRCRSIDGIFSLMRETDRFYRKRAEFTKLIVSVIPYMPDITIVDTGYLQNKWGDLSEYCHKQLKPEESFNSPNREFQEKGFKIIKEIISRFEIWKPANVFGIVDPETMPEEVRTIYNKYVNDEINNDGARRMLVLMEPILRNRLLRQN